MCYEVKCVTCAKITWGGCGKHVQSVYKRIEEAQRCMCKEWPGVNLTTVGSSSQSQPNSANNPISTDSSCNIL